MPTKVTFKLAHDNVASSSCAAQTHQISSVPLAYHRAIGMLHDELYNKGKATDKNQITIAKNPFADSRADRFQLILTNLQGNHLGEGITTPGPHDVICGRGKSANNHPGNVHFRSMIKNVKVMYVNSRKSNKKNFSYAIVQSIRNMNPPGRFLKRDDETNLWFDIGDKQALTKTRQALREGAPKVKKAIDLARSYYQMTDCQMIKKKGDDGGRMQSRKGDASLFLNHEAITIRDSS